MDAMRTYRHIPVMVAEVLEYLRVRPDGVYVDATLGLGGHSEAILSRLTTGRLIGIDRDPMALAMAQERLSGYGERFAAVQGSFSRIGETLAAQGIDRVDGVLADLGVSSMQLENADKGFSFQVSGPLDMRMDPSHPHTASDLVNRLEENELADLIYRNADERNSRRIARAVVRARPIRDTLHLAEVVMGVRTKGRMKLHPATRTFLALRIAVNREKEELEQFLHRTPVHLKAGGRMVVLSYHSLEDRIVKQVFRRAAAGGTLTLLTKKVVTPPPNEVRDNPRARSARLRAAEKSLMN